MQFNFEERKLNEDRLYGPAFTANWWSFMETQLPNINGKKPLPLVFELFSDGTSPGTWGKKLIIIE